jgi:WD40 repeat protein
MGNAYANGKAVLDANAVPFASLSANAVRGLRYTFNDQAEGFGVSATKLCDMCEILSEQLAASENLDLEAKRLKRQVRSLFKTLDTDRNKLVDAIGFLAATALISSMRRLDKLIYIFELFDFASLRRLTADECSMAMVSASIALSSISSAKVPSQDVIESIARRCFDHEGLDWAGGGDTIPIRTMASHVLANNDALAFVNHFHNLYGSGSAPREDEMLSVKVCPAPASEKTLAWYSESGAGVGVGGSSIGSSGPLGGGGGGGGDHDDDDGGDASDASSGGEGDPLDISDAHAEGLRNEISQLRKASKRRPYRETSKLNWRKVVKEGGLAPTEYQRLAEARTLAHQKAREAAGGYDADQEEKMVREATKMTRGAATAPAFSFRLKHVHGLCNSPGTHSHVHYAGPSGEEIVYTAGCVAIVQDVRGAKHQRFFRGHDYEIMGLAVCAGERNVAATGDVHTRRPTIFVWSTETMLPLHCMRGFHTGGVPLLSMSEDGSLLLSCGLDRLHCIAVHRLWYESTAAESALTPGGGESGKGGTVRPFGQNPGGGGGLGAKYDNNDDNDDNDDDDDDDDKTRAYPPIREMHSREGRRGPNTLPPTHPHPSANPKLSSTHYLGTELSSSECELLFSAPTSETPVTDILVLRNNDLMTCGPRHCSFWVADDGAGSSVAQGQHRQLFPRRPSGASSAAGSAVRSASSSAGPDASSSEQMPLPAPPSLRFTQCGGVFHRTVGRRTVSCLAESPRPRGFGLMEAEKHGRVVAGCGATAKGGSGDLIMWRVNDRQCTGARRAHLGHVLSVHWCDGDAPHGTYERTAKTPATPNVAEYGGGRIVSGGADGLVKLWTGNLDLLAEFDISVHGTVSPVVLSVQWCPNSISVEVKDDLNGRPRSPMDEDKEYLESLLLNTEPPLPAAMQKTLGSRVTISADGKRTTTPGRVSRGSSRSSRRSRLTGPPPPTIIQPLLIATAGEVIEIDPADGSPLHEFPLQQTHCVGRVSCMAVHPETIREQYVTGGDDSTIRVWSARTESLVKARPLLDGYIAWIQALAYNPGGTRIAVGVGGADDDDDNADGGDDDDGNNGDQGAIKPNRLLKSKPLEDQGGRRDFAFDRDTLLRDKRPKLSGGWFVLDEKDLSIVFRARDSLSSVTCIRFSPDGEVLAVGSQDGQIYLYNAKSNDYNVLGRCTGLQGPCTHLDFDRNSQVLQTNSSYTKSDQAKVGSTSAMSDEEEVIGEILWYDCRTGEPKLSPEKLADTAWGDETGHAWTCVLGWPVQAAWRSDLERIRLTSVAWRSGLPFGVFGDDTGRVVVYPW